MHPTSYSSYGRRPRQMGGYFLPFLSIIIIGLIVVLAFQLVGYFQEKNNAKLQNKAAVTVVTGRAEMKIWGVDDWTTGISGSILHEGDAIRTAPGSRVMLSLLNGSVIRLNGETEVSLAELKSRDAQDEASLELKRGRIWVKRSTEQAVRANFTVSTAHFNVRSAGTVFSVMQEVREAVHVLEGKVNLTVSVDDVAEGGMRAAETLEVSLGQEVSVSSSDILDLQNRKPVSLLALLSDEFRGSEWYEWNRNEDRIGKGVVTVREAVANQDEPAPVPVRSEASKPVEDAAVNTVALTAPVILTPEESKRTVKGGSVLISGTVSAATEKLEVTTYIGSKAEAYVLQKYKPNSTTWTYVASPEYANLVPGENRYSIVAVGKNGERSAASEVTITYDKPKEPADLSAPTVETFNGGSSSETTSDDVQIQGKIGKGIVKVYVNNFALTRYVQDSKTWSYYAKTAYGNLKEGENMYEVYGEDIDGKKTPVLKFTVTKTKAPSEPAPSSPPPEVNPIL